MQDSSTEAEIVMVVPGIYTPRNGDPIVFIDSKEALGHTQMDQIEENRVILFDQYKREYEREGFEVMHISDGNPLVSLLAEKFK